MHASKTAEIRNFVRSVFATVPLGFYQIQPITGQVYKQTLTPSTPAVPNCCCSKGSTPY